MVDYSGLENRRAERHRGFESLSLRKKSKGSQIDGFPFVSDFQRFLIITILEGKPQKSFTSGRPYYNVDFIGGFDIVLNNTTILPDYNIDFAPLNKPGVMWCNITGNSMYPKLTSGAIIAIREVVSWKDFLTFGEIYAIVTTNDLRTVKIVRKAENENNFKLVPINTAEYDEQEIPKEMVARVFEVLGSINRF